MKVRRSPGERLVYLVESRGTPGHWYRVDLEAGGFRAECSCDDFRFRQKPKRSDGELGECIHIKVALVAFARDMLEEIKEQAIKAYGTSSRDVGAS